MENTLEKAKELAEGAIKSIEAAKPKEESKGASSEEGKEKAEGTKKVADIEAQAKEDERILGAEEKDLSEPDIKRKAVLLETKSKKEESPDEKIKRIKDESQKRIDEKQSELLAERNKRNQDAEAIKKLQDEIAELKKHIQPKVESDEKNRLKTLETERINKYVEEDKVKPREDRREMSKEHLEEWYLEDPLAATEWIQDRSLRRSEERKAELSKKQEEETKNVAKAHSEEFIKKQNESRTKLQAKFPGVIPSAEKIAEMKSKYKTNAEINKALCDDNEEFRLCSEIVAENPKKYLEATDGPELVMAEMEKRLAGKSAGSGGKIELTPEELDERVQAEIDRRANLDEGIISTKGKKLENNEKNKSPQRQHLERIAKKAKIPMADLDKTIERRRNIPGSGVFKQEDDKD